MFRFLLLRRLILIGLFVLIAWGSLLLCYLLEGVSYNYLLISNFVFLGSFILAGWFLLEFCFLLGGLNGATILIRLTGLKNILHQGSGNPGTTNVMRLYGVSAGLFVFLFDFLKGFLPLWILKQISVAFISDLETYFGQIILAASLTQLVCGHIFSPLLNGRGGKGVATLFGGLFAYDFYFFYVATTAWLLTFVLTRLSALSSLIMVAVLASTLIQQKEFFLLPVLCLVFLRHRSNWASWKESKGNQVSGL